MRLRVVTCPRLSVVAATVALATLSTACAGQDAKPLATQAAEALQPAVTGVDTAVMAFLAGTKGIVAQGAQANLKRQAKADAAATRGTRQPLQACIKPGSLIDADVSECMEGTRVRDW